MNEKTIPLDLDSTQALNLLHTLAAQDPQYPAIAKQLAPLALVSLSPQEQAILTHATLEALSEDPQHSPAVTTLVNNPPPQRFETSLLSAGLLVAVVFLLRNHIRIEGKARDLKFTFERKSTDSQALSTLLNKLASLLPKTNQD